MKKSPRNAFVLFDGARFCPGELPVSEHLEQIKIQVLFYRGVQAEILSKLASDPGLTNRTLLKASDQACQKVIDLLAESYGALAHFSDVAEDDL